MLAPPRAPGRGFESDLASLAVTPALSNPSKELMVGTAGFEPATP